MFYILMALRAILREQGWFTSKNIKEPNLAELLDLVALGTVADVVPLDHNNRILVAQGLSRIRAGKCCAGIKALLQVANRSFHSITAQDLSFTIGPRLNAAGRLTDMSLGIECLLCDNEHDARQLAAQLDKLNKERREIQEEMQIQALDDLESMDLGADQQLPAGLCLFNEDWHQGVIGILASKIKDKVNRPVIAFAKDKDGFIKGSARSVNGVHVRDVLDRIASHHPGIIDKFGGHAMAAGLTMQESDFEQFKKLFDQVVSEHISADSLDGTLMTDGELSAGELDFGLAEEIISAGPWGQGFPEPVFDGEFELVDSRIVGKKHLKLQLRIKEQDGIIDAIAFNTTHDEWPAETEHVQTVYKLDINEYAGRRQLQLVIDYIAPLEVPLGN
ncbi:MAG: DHHA1 domain-containing protein, partial [Gammaproteobacteria bacterium]